MIEAIGPDKVLFMGRSFGEVAIARMNAKLSEPWQPEERRNGRRVSFREVGVSNPLSAETLADAFRRKGWEVAIEDGAMRLRAAR